MRILVLSDSHRRSGEIEKIIESQPNARHIFFLGDLLHDIEYLPEIYSDRTFYSVPGNCDFANFEPTTRTVTLAGRKILYTHGHEYGVKSGIERLLSYATAREADIVLYGHTHIAQTLYRDGLTVVNPGSVGKGAMFNSYAVIDIEPSGNLPIIIKI